MQRIACFFLVALMGCTSGPLKPLTPAEERELQAQIMAQDLCKDSPNSECRKRAVRWYKKLTKKGSKCPGSTNTR